MIKKRKTLETRFWKWFVPENPFKVIQGYFDNRSTNASAESFNAKIKAFRAQFRGVRNIDFFLFRWSNLFA